jgi:serine/threonine protein kinase
MGQSSGKPVVFTDQGMPLPAAPPCRASAWPWHPSVFRPMLNSAPVNLNHFRLLRVVGKGAFGKVRIVERKDTGLTFALKYIRKDEGQRYPFLPNTIRTSMLMPCNSRTIRERPQHHPRTAHARTPQPPLPVQPAVQLPGHRISVRGPHRTYNATY